MRNDLKWVLIIVAGLLVLTNVMTCKQNLKDRATIQQLQQNYKLDSIKNVEGKKVYVQQMEETNQATIRLYTDSIFNLNKKHAKQIKDVIAYYSERTITKIDTVEVPYVDTAERKRFADSLERYCKDVIAYYEDSTVKVGTRAVVDSPYYHIDLTVKKPGVTANNITFKDSQYVRITLLKGGLLKKDQQGKRRLFLRKSYRVEVLHKNPYLQVQGANSIIYKPPRSSNIIGKALLIGAGVIGGVYLNK